MTGLLDNPVPADPLPVVRDPGMLLVDIERCLARADAEIQHARDFACLMAAEINRRAKSGQIMRGE